MAMTAEDQARPGPYAHAAQVYWHSGWAGPLPLPYGRKTPPPAGFTGERGTWPSYPDMMTWAIGPEGAGNVGLRLPHHVIGLDVDNYGTKLGGATIAACEAAWGPLPSTWRSTSRDDGVSGIRLYRAPEGLCWPGEIGPGTEVIQHRHRYAVVWPSLHPEGRVYRWLNPAGATSTAVPAVDDLPELPDAWVMGITNGEMATESVRADVSTEQAQEWLPAAAGDFCDRMRTAASRAHRDVMAATGSVHEVTRNHILRLVRLHEQEHRGAGRALHSLRLLFVSNVTNPTRGGDCRTDRVAEGEWDRMVTSAVSLAKGNPSAATCMCDRPVLGVLKVSTSSDYTDNGHADSNGSEPPRPEGDTRDHTSWWPVDLAAVLAGDFEEPEPQFLARDDGHRLFYRGRVNGLLGESESGKSWVALLAVLQAIQVGSPVLFVDFEDTAKGILSRLSDMGMTDANLVHLRYMAPDESLSEAANADFSEALAAHQPVLVVVDGVNAAMTILGYELESNKDATEFAQRVLVPLTRTGAAVVAVDHVPKNRDARGKGGIGAQAKRAMTTGCALSVEVVVPFGRGMTGQLQLTVDKDRPGMVRAKSAGAKNAGKAILESDDESGKVVVRIQSPDLRPKAEKPPFRPTVLMERVSHFLSTCPDGASGNAIEKEVTGKGPALRIALDLLVEGGYIRRESRARGEVRHIHDLPYTEDLG